MEWTWIVNLGIGGFAILVMWWMFQASGKERERHDARMDKLMGSFRELEHDVRDKVMGLLMQNSKVMQENTKTIERVLDHLRR
jgi:hypothetical protein